MTRDSDMTTAGDASGGEQTVIVAASAYIFDQGRRLSGCHTQSLGLDQRWLASVGIFTVLGGFGDEAWVDSIPCTLLAQRLSGASVVCRHGKAGGREGRSTSLTLQPCGVPNHYTADGSIRFAQIYLDNELIDRVANELRPGAKASGRMRDDLIFHGDPDLERLVGGYLDAATRAETRLELEARAILMVGHLLRAHHGFGHPKVTRGGLAPWQLKRATDAIEAHLGEEIGLDTLADVVGCSPTHFSRAFKQSTGRPPFQWLLERRIARAKEMLADTSQSLAEIALAVGFSAQPQFTTAFRRVAGTTPGAWRRERLS